MDAHKDSISVRILRSEEESPAVERIFNEEPSVRRLLARFADPSQAVGLLRGRADGGNPSVKSAQRHARSDGCCDLRFP